MGWDYEDAEDAYWSFHSDGYDAGDNANEHDHAYAPFTLDNSPTKVRKSGSVARWAEKIVNGKAISMRDMSTEELEAMIDAAQSEINRRSRLPQEPNDSDMIVLQFAFAGREKVYTYAAVKSDGLWYTTGGSLRPNRGTWTEMIDWFHNHGKILAMHATIKHYRIVLP